jgi:hypothetical protein
MGEQKADIVVVSFKKNYEEQELLAWITSHSGKSTFVKDILKNAMIVEKIRLSEKVETSIIWGGSYEA